MSPEQGHKRDNGGQGGCTKDAVYQQLTATNRHGTDIEIIGEVLSTSNRVQTAALRLSLNRSGIEGHVIPLLKERFGLRNLEAIEAAKQAHALQFGACHE